MGEVNRRTRHLWVIALVAIVLPVAVLADSDPAGALLPEWVYDWADDAYEGCLDLPENLMGTASNVNLAYVAPGVGPAGATVTGTGVGATSVGGSVALAGAQAAFVAGGVVLGTCAIINIHQWVFGTPQYDGPLVDWDDAFERVGLHSCVAPLPVGYTAGDLCVSLQDKPGGYQPTQNPTFPIPGVMRRGQANVYGPSVPCWSTYGGSHGYADFAIRLRDGTYGCNHGDFQARSEFGNGTDVEAVPQFDLNGRLQVAVPCASPELMCGLAAPWRQDANTQPYVESDERLTAGWRLWLNGCPSGLCWMGIGPILSDEQLALGQPKRIRHRLLCRRPANGHEVELSETSGIFWSGEADSPVSWNQAQCPPGYAPIEVDVFRQRAIGGALQPGVWYDEPQRLLWWRADPAVVSNPDALACFVNPGQGLQTCPIHDDDPENPSARKRLGGPNGVPFPKNAPTTTTKTIPEILEKLPFPQNDPREGPSPSTTTTTVAPTTTIAPPEDPENCEGVHCAGGPGVPPPESEGSECWPSGWGWLNPVEWVLRPIKCALMWAFWDQESAEDMAALGSEHGWTQAVTESSVNTDPAAGPCLTLDHGAEICTEPILSYEVPSVVEALVAAVVLFFGLFEVIGLFARISGG